MLYSRNTPVNHPKINVATESVKPSTSSLAPSPPESPVFDAIVNPDGLADFVKEKLIFAYSISVKTGRIVSTKGTTISVNVPKVCPMQAYDFVKSLFLSNIFLTRL